MLYHIFCLDWIRNSSKIPHQKGILNLMDFTYKEMQSKILCDMLLNHFQ